MGRRRRLLRLVVLVLVLVVAPRRCSSGASPVLRRWLSSVAKLKRGGVGAAQRCLAAAGVSTLRGAAARWARHGRLLPLLPSDAVSHAVPDDVSHAVSDDVSDAVSDAVSNDVSDDVSDDVSGDASDNVSNAVSNAASDAGLAPHGRKVKVPIRLLGRGPKTRRRWRDCSMVWSSDRASAHSRARTAARIPIRERGCVVGI